MSAFASRTGGYRGGVLLLFLAFVLFVVGYVAPFWASKTYGASGFEYSLNEGPWMLCASASAIGYSSVSCGTYGFDLAGWFHAVRALECVCLVLLFIACVYALATNCCRTVPGPRTRVLEALASTGGVLGLVGVIVYGVLRNDQSTSSDGRVSFAIDVLLAGDWTISWALYVAGVGSGLAVIAAIIIGVSNKEISQPTTGAVIGMAPVVFATQQQTASYPAYAGGYPAQQAGYPAQQAGYPAQQGFNPGYPEGYQPPQAGYPVKN